MSLGFLKSQPTLLAVSEAYLVIGAYFVSFKCPNKSMQGCLDLQYYGISLWAYLSLLVESIVHACIFLFNILVQIYFSLPFSVWSSLQALEASTPSKLSCQKLNCLNHGLALLCLISVFPCSYLVKTHVCTCSFSFLLLSTAFSSLFIAYDFTVSIKAQLNES